VSYFCYFLKKTAKDSHTRNENSPSLVTLLSSQQGQVRSWAQTVSVPLESLFPHFDGLLARVGDRLRAASAAAERLTIGKKLANQFRITPEVCSAAHCGLLNFCRK
jgi:hypothetical protein